MKKTLVITSLLFILSIGFIAVLHTSLLKEKDQVTYQDTILCGDASMAEGITVQCNTQYDQKLFWNTTYKPGKHPVTKTEYRMYTTEQEESYEPADEMTIETYIPSQYGVIRDENSAQATEVPIIYEDLYKKVKKNETKEATIFVKDYFDYYPLKCDINIQGKDYFISSDFAYFADEYEDGPLLPLLDFLKIPVLEEEQWNISVHKDSSNEYSLNSEKCDTDSFEFMTHSVVGEEKVFFTFHPFTTNGYLVDTSHIPGGFGIYAFSYSDLGENKDADAPAFDMTGLANVYPLNPEEYIYRMSMSEDKSKIFLFTEDSLSDGTKITVIDALTIETLQTVNIPAIKNDTASERLVVNEVYQYDDFFVLLCSFDYLVVMEQDRDGQYRLALISKLPEPDSAYEDILNYFSMPIGMDWNSRELVMVQPLFLGTSYGLQESASFQISIFDENGLKYYSQHISSLNTAYSNDFESVITYQEAKEPSLRVSWD